MWWDGFMHYCAFCQLSEFLFGLVEPQWCQIKSALTGFLRIMRHQTPGLRSRLLSDPHDGGVVHAHTGLNEKTKTNRLMEEVGMVRSRRETNWFPEALFAVRNQSTATQCTRGKDDGWAWVISSPKQTTLTFYNLQTKQSFKILLESAQDACSTLKSHLLCSILCSKRNLSCGAQTFISVPVSVFTPRFRLSSTLH